MGWARGLRGEVTAVHQGAKPCPAGQPGRAPPEPHRGRAWNIGRRSGGSGAGLRRTTLIGGLGGKVPEDLRGHSRLGDEGDDAHRLAASRTQEGIDLEDAAHQLGPPAAQRRELGIILRLGGGRRWAALGAISACGLLSPSPRSDHARVRAAGADEVQPRLTRAARGASSIRRLRIVVLLLGLPLVLEALAPDLATAVPPHRRTGCIAARPERNRIHRKEVH